MRNRCNGTGLSSTAAGGRFQSLTVPADGGTPYFSAIDLSQSESVTGILPTDRGGIGVNSTATFPTSGVVVTDTSIQTLSGKTLTAPMINDGTISGTTLITGATTIDTTSSISANCIASAGNIVIKGNSTTANRLVLNDRGSINSYALKAPD